MTADEYMRIAQAMPGAGSSADVFRLMQMGLPTVTPIGGASYAPGPMPMMQQQQGGGLFGGGGMGGLLDAGKQMGGALSGMFGGSPTTPVQGAPQAIIPKGGLPIMQGGAMWS